MAYTNSGLVVYTKLSPNHSGQRTHAINRITPHCVVGQLSAESICGCFTSTSRQASCNYGIGTDGRVSLCVEEKNRSWCSSSSANDQRAVTIECASDKTDPYAMNSAVYAALINLCVDICRRNGKSKLLWLADKDKTLNYSPAAEEMVLTVHRWFANKSCPGDWLYNRLSDLAAKVTAKLSGGVTTGTQAKNFASLTEAQVIAKVGPLFTADQKKSGILASVSLAQFILESGYGKSELAQNANNCFGMKKSLSGNTWSGSAWDGISVYTKKTQEYENGAYVTVTADFRKYTCVEDSIADHSAYLLGAKNGSNLRYAGIAGVTDYKAVAQLIKAGGYATSPTYVENLCSIIEKWNLTQYDAGSTGNPSDTDGSAPSDGSSANSSFPALPFTVKVVIPDLNYRSEPSMSGAVKGQTGKGTFTITKLSGSWGYLKSGAGWIYLGNPSYCTIGSTIGSTVTDNSSSGTSSVPYKVKVNINDLNIREKPTVSAKSLGYTRKGVFTIVKEAAGEGSDKGWGLLKAYAGKENGWIALDYAEKQ